MAKAESAIRTAPGVLAVIVNYEQKQAQIGTRAGTGASTEEIIAALESIGYQGELIEFQPAEAAATATEGHAP